jgi:hypothetical protein
MPDISATTTDEAGLTRTPDGTLAQPTTESSNQTTTPPPNQSTKAEGDTLLNKTEPAAKVESKTPEGEDKSKTESKTGAPEKYEDYNVPDGLTLSPELKTEADALFKGMNLSQAQAQSLIDMHTKQMASAAQASAEAYKAIVDGWKAEAESHPDLRGKLGPGQEVNVRIAKALDNLGDPKLASDFRSLMDLTGAGNNQAFIRVLDAFAKQVTEGSHVAGNGPAKAGQSGPNQAAPSAAGALWPNLPSAGGR